jgi:hypothetical protein
MPAKLASLLLTAVSLSGAYDPDVALIYVEEQMTAKEYKVAQPFLAWIHSNNLTFGHGNILVRFREYQKAVRRCQ